MVRKTKEEAEKTRIGLLEAALKVFSTKGFVRSTLNDIAAVAGVSRGAFYWHFKDKADVLDALSLYVESRSGDTRETYLEENLHSLAEVRRLMVKCIVSLDTDPTYRTFFEFINFKIEYHEELDGVLAKQRKLKRDFMEKFEADFRRIQASGEMRKDIEPRQAALMTMFFYSGLIEIWLFDNELFSLHTDAPAMIDQFLQGFRVPKQDQSPELQ